MKYFSDKAIQSPLDDKLGYSHFAYYLAKSIASVEKTTNSYVIGVCGKWGDGKTSAINMALYYLKYLITNPNESIDNINKILELESEKNEKSFSEENIISKSLPARRIILNFILSAILFSILTFCLIFITFLFLDTYISPQIAFNIYIVLKVFVGISLIYFIFKNFIYFFIKLLISPVYITAPLINLIEKFINLFTPKDYIVIKFEPWNYTNCENILKEFFKQLIKGTGNQSDIESLKQASKLISIYSKLILNKDISIIERLLKDEDINSLKESIFKKLEKSDKKIIIVIDDIDRLLPEEALLIFQTVRLIANFPNITYILLFDKDKICEDIKNKFNLDGQEFLKKIIQIEKNLPIIDKNILKQNFINFIDETTTESNLKNLEEISFLYDFALQGRYINNIRDLNKFFNSFNFIYQAYKKEKINICDLAAITAIEIFEQPLYLFIRDHKNVFCSSTVGMYGKDNYVYTNEGTINLNEFAEKLNKFSNIHIISILFLNLFQKIKDSIKTYNSKTNRFKDKEELPEEIICLNNSINDKINEFIMSEPYRTISQPTFFDNYFRHNFEKYALTANEKNLIIENFSDVNKFKEIMMSLYLYNPEKITDFIRDWDSSSNLNLKTKENILLYLLNFLSLGDNESELRRFLHKQDFFSGISRLVKEFNQENQKKITFYNIYNLINQSINFLNNNIFFFVYLVCYNFKFPSNDPPVLDSNDIGYLNKIIELITQNITYEGLLNDPETLTSLKYLREYLNGEECVDKFINEILEIGKEKDLLTILLTGQRGFMYMSNYGFSAGFFKEIGKDKELKNKLLDIYYDDKFYDLMNDSKFIVIGEYTQKKHIVAIVLDFLIDNLKISEAISKILQEFITVEGKEKVLNIIYEEIKDRSEKEIRFLKENSFDNEIRSADGYLKQIKKEEPDLYDKYKDRLELLIV